MFRRASALEEPMTQSNLNQIEPIGTQENWLSTTDETLWERCMASPDADLRPLHQVHARSFDVPEIVLLWSWFSEAKQVYAI